MSERTELALLILGVEVGVDRARFYQSEGATPWKKTLDQADAVRDWLAAHAAQMKADAFEEGAEAFAWAQQHGDEPAHYVLENNPYRRTE